MTRLPLRSPVIATWLFVVATLIALMVLVGGTTRLTRSGLSITEWRPVTGVMPPISESGWQTEFDKYRHTPQFKYINAHMDLEAFKGIYFWEWFHRLLGRMIGAAVLIPYIVFLTRSEVPKRMIWRLSLLLGLGALQGVIGWWMVQSGLENAVTVAPERLAIHLFMALGLLILCLWFGWESLAGEPRGRGGPGSWRLASGIALGLIYLQMLLGAFVAGNQAGFLYNSWPLMNGNIVPYVDWTQGAWQVLFHDPGAVQFIHRTNAYLVAIYLLIFLISFLQNCRDEGLRNIVKTLFGLIIVQITLGVLTLLSVVNIYIALGHQLTGMACLALATWLNWKVARADRDFN